MTGAGQLGKHLKFAKNSLSGLKRRVGSMGKAAVAAIAGAALVAGNAVSSAADGAAKLKDQAFNNNKKSREVIEMKKSTVVALLVALAAVAGVLGALYFYVLRRERELDEYEQLLFSEDFNDDLLDDAAPEDAED
ncbi:hypothetical protein LJC60_02940 [Ruminococcaceae bacterium OttesenSCG-928-D13]|nr:hypothetical protein [Ruminococcaceae bacterium OttesenSCG-928-D13]